MGKSGEMEISVVIPVYGSENILEELVSRLVETLESTTSIGCNYQIIFVCDNSPDESWRVISELSKDFDQVNGVLLRMNAGQHNALMAGFGVASGKYIITMDDDLQHDPSDIPLLLNSVKNGADVAYARFKDRKHKTWKKLGSSINDVVAGYLLQKPKGVYLSPFRVLREDIKNDVLKYTGPYVYMDGLILGVTRNISMVDVDHHERYEGGSGYSLRKSFSLWLKMATNFSIVPLRITSLMGLIFSGLGFIMALFFVIQKFTTDAMPVGWSSIVVVTLIIGGVQLLALGMLGEYLGRVLLTINSRPQFVIADKVGGETKGSRVP